MIRRDGERMQVSGPLTLHNVAAVLREGSAVIAEGARVVDLKDVGELDSSALALLLAWMRAAKGAGREIADVHHHRGALRLGALARRQRGNEGHGRGHRGGAAGHAGGNEPLAALGIANRQGGGFKGQGRRGHGGLPEHQ